MNDLHHPPLTMEAAAPSACTHRSDGWCLACVGHLQAELAAAQQCIRGHEQTALAHSSEAMVQRCMARERATEGG